jgi:hypothetical protein
MFAEEKVEPSTWNFCAVGPQNSGQPLRHTDRVVQVLLFHNDELPPQRLGNRFRAAEKQPHSRGLHIPVETGHP